MTLKGGKHLTKVGLDTTAQVKGPEIAVILD